MEGEAALVTEPADGRYSALWESERHPGPERGYAPAPVGQSRAARSRAGLQEVRRSHAVRPVWRGMWQLAVRLLNWNVKYPDR